MTETTTNMEPTAEVATRPSGTLMSLIIALLAPMFLGVSGGDVGLARLAAIETVNAYRARNHADLLAVAQIVAFGLAALGSLSLSLADEIAIPMALRLRANANACNRSAEQNRRALARSLADNTLPQPPMDEPASPPTLADDDPSPGEDAFLSGAAAGLLAAESQARLEPTARRISVSPPASATAPAPTAKRHQEVWAIAMAKEASKITASLPHLRPREREAARMRAALLSSTAHDLTCGPTVPPLKPEPLAGMLAPDVSEQPPLSP